MMSPSLFEFQGFAEHNLPYASLEGGGDKTLNVHSTLLQSSGNSEFQQKRGN